MPNMSYRPQAIGRLPPTGWGRHSELHWYQATSSSLPYLGPEVPARQACSHSASVGSRYPSAEASQPTVSVSRSKWYAGRSPSRRYNASQNRTASSHETPSTGSRSPWALLGRRPVTWAYHDCVTGSTGSWNGATSTGQLLRVRLFV